MKKFILKFSAILAILSVIIILIAYILEVIIQKNTNKKQYLLHADWNSKIKENYDILFIGNSRVWIQINSELISNKTNLKVYDLTQNGKSVKLLWYKFRNYTKFNSPPKELFLQFDNRFISNEYPVATYEKEFFLSYIYLDPLKLNKLFKEEIGIKDYETYIPLIRYYGYSSILYSHLTGIQNCDWLDSNTYKFGFYPRKYSWDANWNKPLIYNYNSKNLNYIDSFRIYCQANNVKLHLFHPPQSTTSYNVRSDENKKVIENYICKYNLEFTDFNSNIYNDSTIFSDHIHLNQKGSQIFTNQIIERYFKKN